MKAIKKGILVLPSDPEPLEPNAQIDMTGVIKTSSRRRAIHLCEQSWMLLQHISAQSHLPMTSIVEYLLERESPDMIINHLKEQVQNKILRPRIRGRRKASYRT